MPPDRPRAGGISLSGMAGEAEWPRGSAGLPRAGKRANAAPMSPSAFYAGSFDPLTNGHLDVLRHAFRLVGRLVVGIGAQPSKTPLFSVEARAELIREAAGPLAKAAGAV